MAYTLSGKYDEMLSTLANLDTASISEDISTVTNNLSTISGYTDDVESSVSTVINTLENVATESSISTVISTLENVATESSISTVSHNIDAVKTNVSTVINTLEDVATESSLSTVAHDIDSIKLLLNDANLVAENIKAGVEIAGVVGTYTADADATDTDIVSGKTGYVNGIKITGTHSCIVG